MNNSVGSLELFSALIQLLAFARWGVAPMPIWISKASAKEQVHGDGVRHGLLTE